MRCSTAGLDAALQINYLAKWDRSKCARRLLPRGFLFGRAPLPAKTGVNALMRRARLPGIVPRDVEIEEAVAAV